MKNQSPKKITRQSAVFLNFYILPDYVDTLKQLLNSGEKPSGDTLLFPFEKMESVHFARWLIAPATHKFKASLIYSGNIDGTQEQHLNDLVKIASESLDIILSFCQGYPNKPTIESRLAFLKEHSSSSSAFYVGAPNRSVTQIKEEEKFHTAVQYFVKENGEEWKTKQEAYAAIKEFVASDPKWAEMNKQFSLPKKNGMKMILLLLILILSFPLILITVLLIFLFYENRLKPFGKTIDEIDLSHLELLKNQEDIIYQNQLSQVFETKGGLRKLFLRFILWATNISAKNWFVDGSLMGTPTIHFARWAFIDDGDRFVFFSNFDGSYDGYLSDFVDNNGWGLNAIYGAAVGYPKTHFVFGRGSYKILEFLGWGRQTQVPTPIWYSAYPWSGLQQIVDRSLLRDELLNKSNLTDLEIKKTLSRI